MYHQYSFDDILTAPADGYHVILSTSDAVDDHRLLVPDGRVDERAAVSNDNIFEHCGAAADDAGQGLMPREPGTYYWQVYRVCEAYVCIGGVEVTDVWSVRVKRTVCSVDRGELSKARAQLKAARAALALRRRRAAARGSRG